MLFERRTRRRAGQQAKPDHDPSVFPPPPLIAGPGAIAAMILLMGQTGPGWGGAIMLIGLLCTMILAAFLILLASPIIERALGRTGTPVITRLLGMLLAALSIQFMIDGIKSAGFF